MLDWFKRLHRSAAFASTSAAARMHWNFCFIKASRGGARYFDMTFWQEVADSFLTKWREIEPAERDPGRLLEKRMDVYLGFLADKVLPQAECGNLTTAQLEGAGVFIARASVLDLREALLSDPETAAPVFHLLPQPWLETARVSREEFDFYYTQRTGKNRDIQRLEDAVGKETADKIVRHMSGLTEQRQGDFVQEFKEHMQKSIKGPPPIVPPVPRQAVRLPSDGLYIHLNGDAKGPFTVEQLKALLAVQTITNETLCCHNGADAWQTVGVYLA
jgi:hypothetical protein